MAKEFKIPSIKKVVTVLSILWPIACACMLLSMHYFTRNLIVFFTTLALVPIVVSWVLFFVSRHLDKSTEPLWMRNRGKGGGKGKGQGGGKGKGGGQGKAAGRANAEGTAKKAI